VVVNRIIDKNEKLPLPTLSGDPQKKRPSPNAANPPSWWVSKKDSNLASCNLPEFPTLRRFLSVYQIVGRFLSVYQILKDNFASAFLPLFEQSTGYFLAIPDGSVEVLSSDLGSVQLEFSTFSLRTGDNAICGGGV
jgi:hypothetical protein